MQMDAAEGAEEEDVEESLRSFFGATLEGADVELIRSGSVTGSNLLRG